MSLTAERSANVQYTFTDCFAAVIKAIDTLPKYSIIASSQTTGSFDVNIKASYNSYGERMTIELSDTGSTCSIKVSTTPKAPYLLWRGKCEKNNAEFFAALDIALSDYPIRATSKSTQAGSVSPIETRLQKLKELFDAGHITQEEYNSKRSDILAEL